MNASPPGSASGVTSGPLSHDPFLVISPRMEILGMLSFVPMGSSSHAELPGLGGP